MSKFYAVKTGKEPGIYTNWKNCEQQVKGYSGATYKSFKTFEEAKQYMGLNGKLNSEKSSNEKQNTWKSSGEKQNSEKSSEEKQNMSEVDKALRLINSIPSKDIICYTDGSCKGNPGEAGSGIYIVWPGGAYETSIAKYLGKSTNNIAELTAIKIAFETITSMIDSYPQLLTTNPELYLLTDSEYSLNALTGKTRVNANAELINSIKLIMTNYKLKINMFWVPAHSGIPGNEKANDLAEQSSTNKIDY
jgi:ribonuclease HI